SASRVERRQCRAFHLHHGTVHALPPCIPPIIRGDHDLSRIVPIPETDLVVVAATDGPTAIHIVSFSTSRCLREIRLPPPFSGVKEVMVYGMGMVVMAHSREALASRSCLHAVLHYPLYL